MGVGRLTLVSPEALTKSSSDKFRRKREESPMSGDPKQCRLYAIRCAELANTAKAKQLKDSLLELSLNWVRLAESLEMTHSLLDEESPSRRTR